jgi:hypothetical protein
MILIHSPSTASNCELFDFLGFVQFEFFIFFFGHTVLFVTQHARMVS